MKSRNEWRASIIVAIITKLNEDCVKVANEKVFK